jgi:hypothetical protein
MSEWSGGLAARRVQTNTDDKPKIVQSHGLISMAPSDRRDGGRSSLYAARRVSTVAMFLRATVAEFGSKNLCLQLGARRQLSPASGKRSMLLGPQYSTNRSDSQLIHYVI